MNPTLSEQIYSRLRSKGASEDAIEKIKSLGGPEKVDWDSLGGKLDLATRHFIGRTLLEAEIV